MKKALLALVVLAAIGGSVYAYYVYSQRRVQPTVMTAAVTRGDIADTVGATGTLQAVTTVQVGTQVSGIVQELHADFNSLVKKGQVLARLDPSTILTQIEQAKANLIRGQADLERLKITLEDARNKLKRTEELAARQIVSQIELEAAQVAVKAAEAQIRSSEAGLTQSQASLRQLEVNLGYTTVTAPIDGLVISRNVDPGQTVAASMNAPTLFILAADLTKMQLLSNIDESDVGRIRPGQEVRFRVDAFPAEDFTGKVVQVRLNPIVQQNVVSYATVIAVENPELKLKPGMTANVNIEIARRHDAIRIPNAALRFRPTSEIFASLDQVPPEDAPGGRGDMARGRRAMVPAANSESGGRGPQRSPAPHQETGTGRDERPNIEPRIAGGGRGRNGENGGWQNLSPEERERMMQARGGGSGGGGRSGRPQGAPQPAQAGRAEATTIDALFGPLPTVESRGRVWLYADKQLKPVNLRLGISDGQATELIEGDIDPGVELVTNIVSGSETRPSTSGPQNFSPFGPPRGGRSYFGNPGSGGNRGGGRPR